jgi:hypothetical protein
LAETEVCAPNLTFCVLQCTPDRSTIDCRSVLFLRAERRGAWRKEHSLVACGQWTSGAKEAFQATVSPQRKQDKK